MAFVDELISLIQNTDKSDDDSANFIAEYFASNTMMTKGDKYKLVNARIDENGTTLLQLLASHSCYNTASELFEHGANPYLRDKHGYSALWHATSPSTLKSAIKTYGFDSGINTQAKIVQLLLRNGVGLCDRIAQARDITDSHNLNALMERLDFQQIIVLQLAVGGVLINTLAKGHEALAPTAYKNFELAITTHEKLLEVFASKDDGYKRKTISTCHQIYTAISELPQSENRDEKLKFLKELADELGAPIPSKKENVADKIKHLFRFGRSSSESSAAAAAATSTATLSHTGSSKKNSP